MWQTIKNNVGYLNHINSKQHRINERQSFKFQVTIKLTKIKTMTSVEQIEDLLEQCKCYLENRIQEQELHESGCNIKYIANIDLNIFKFKNI